tara:strand:- start:138 stop:1223 length:1086 start_codon:yes stop_codon:yes gene_type:complete
MVTQTQFQDFKTEAIKNQPIRKTIRLSELNFRTMDTVEYNGIYLGCNRQALKDLFRILGMTQAAYSNLQSSLGEDVSTNFLNTLKNAISSAKSLELTIAVTPDRVISRIEKAGQSSIISAQTYFDTFERMANEHNLEIKSTDFNKANGNIYLSTVNPSNQHQIAGLSNEVFQTGMSFSKTADGILADPFMERMVCTNGMVTRQFEESFKLRSMDPKMWSEFYQHLEKIEKANFVPSKFNEAVNRAIQTPASLAELERGITLMTNNSNMSPEEVEMFIKGTKRTYNKIHSAGIDTVKLNNDQRKNLRTGVSVWDVINGITDFSSHNYGYEKKANSDRHLQMMAGDLLSKKFDTQNLMLSQPF